MTRLAAPLLVAVILAACTTTATPSPVPGVTIAGVSTVCDPGPTWPLAPTCASAVAAALPASGYVAAAIDFVEFHYGTYCPPGAPCASSLPTSGYVVVHPKERGPDLLVALQADSTGKVTVDGTRPLPSTMPSE